MLGIVSLSAQMSQIASNPTPLYLDDCKSSALPSWCNTAGTTGSLTYDSTYNCRISTVTTSQGVYYTLPAASLKGAITLEVVHETVAFSGYAPFIVELVDSTASSYVYINFDTFSSGQIRLYDYVTLLSQATDSLGRVWRTTISLASGGSSKRFCVGVNSPTDHITDGAAGFNNLFISGQTAWADGNTIVPTIFSYAGSGGSDARTVRLYKVALHRGGA